MAAMAEAAMDGGMAGDTFLTDVFANQADKQTKGKATFASAQKSQIKSSSRAGSNRINQTASKAQK